nr:L,D-transpeptidase [Ensifer adhaerens]
MVNTTALLEILTAKPKPFHSRQSEAPDPAIIRLQVLLDRAGASPGVIDGHAGDNVQKAITAFEAMQGLPVDGDLDRETIARLETREPIIITYVVSDADLENLTESIPHDFAKMARMDHLGFTSVAERLSERFHMDIDLFHALNPHATLAVGGKVRVTGTGSPKTGQVARIEVDSRRGQARAFEADGLLIAAYPATIGSEETPAPTGNHKVKGVAHLPDYTYNPKVNFQQGKNADVLTLPSGPNNPVGTVWIDLTKPTYGIHGTPEPSLIDKVGSHGCVRLTNWDAEELASMVKPGVAVIFVHE